MPFSFFYIYLEKFQDLSSDNFTTIEYIQLKLPTHRPIIPIIIRMISLIRIHFRHPSLSGQCAEISRIAGKAILSADKLTAPTSDMKSPSSGTVAARITEKRYSFRDVNTSRYVFKNQSSSSRVSKTILTLILTYKNIGLAFLILRRKIRFIQIQSFEF